MIETLPVNPENCFRPQGAITVLKDPWQCKDYWSEACSKNGALIRPRSYLTREVLSKYSKVPQALCAPWDTSLSRDRGYVNSWKFRTSWILLHDNLISLNRLGRCTDVSPDKRGLSVMLKPSHVIFPFFLS